MQHWLEVKRRNFSLWSHLLVHRVVQRSGLLTQPQGVSAAVWGSRPVFFVLTWVVLSRRSCSPWWRGAGNGSLDGGPLNLNFSSEIKWLQKNRTICLPKSLSLQESNFTSRKLNYYSCTPDSIIVEAVCFGRHSASRGPSHTERKSHFYRWLHRLSVSFSWVCHSAH